MLSPPPSPSLPLSLSFLTHSLSFSFHQSHETQSILGAFLLSELIEYFESSSSPSSSPSPSPSPVVYVLVRAPSNESAYERVKANLAKYKLWRKEWESESISEREREEGEGEGGGEKLGFGVGRVRAIAGDLATDLFGLSPSLFLSLSSRLSIIFHCGAQVPPISVPHSLSHTLSHSLSHTLSLSLFLCPPRFYSLISNDSFR